MRASLMKALLTLHRLAVSFYLSLCPVPPGNNYLYASFDVPAPTSTARDRFNQILVFATLGLPPLVLVPVLATLLPGEGRIVATAWLGAVLWFLASVDVAAKKRAVEELRAYEREAL